MLDLDLGLFFFFFLIFSLWNCKIDFLLLPSIVDFFKELPQFVVKTRSVLSGLYGTDWENRLEVFTC